MILFYGLPPQAGIHDGFFRRIAYIDSLFCNHERIYFYPAGSNGKETPSTPIIEKRSDKVSFVPFNFMYSTHSEFFVSLLQKCDFLYAHTTHSAQYLSPYYASGKIITDLHGIAPEEELLHGQQRESRFFGVFEKIMINESLRVIGVSREMFLHHKTKYGLDEDRFILLPITCGIIPEARKPRTGKPLVVYAGGAQAWQRVPEMLQAVRALHERCDFLFLTHQRDEFEKQARVAGVFPYLKIDSCAPEDLPGYYAQADFGLCLREDSAVNRVACPTKLMEYAACGVVPIVESDRVGDFFSLGGRGVHLVDMLTGNFPNDAQKTNILNANYAVLETMRELARKGEAALLSLPPVRSHLSADEWEFLFLSDIARNLFPAQDMHPIDIALYNRAQLGGNTSQQASDALCGAQPVNRLNKLELVLFPKDSKRRKLAKRMRDFLLS